MFLEDGGFSKGIKAVLLPAPTSVFISYNWVTKLTANRIAELLSQQGFIISKDDLDLTYKDSISNFMESIRGNDFAILLISK
ncbi:TIR domain-containing protein [Chitinophaga sp. W2I13]|uniref:TIR domain-containing protein n=1 Tax=Chitinophaga sp. W2I13 TaxID=3373923 RepID=UPI003D21BF38